MQADQGLSLHTYCHEEKFDETESETVKISFELTEKLKIKESQPEREFKHDEEEETEDDSYDDDENEEEEDGDDFSFASVSEELISPVAADKVFQDGQIRPMFPLFNRNLLLDGNASPNRLPTRPPVDKVFIESPRRASNASENDEIEGTVAGPYCWTKPAAPEFGGKKSNSTGFSKLWRFKERINRSHSDGRDAFVFLNNTSTSSSSSSSSLIKREEKLEKKLSSSSGKKANGEVKVNGNEGKVKSSKKGGKKKLTSLSPHEAYLRSKLTEDDRRRSYMPYRPELMGFFTSVHGGGLTKNVHPF